MDKQTYELELIEVGTLIDGPEDQLLTVATMYARLIDLENTRFYTGLNKVIKWNDDKDIKVGALDKKTVVDFFTTMAKGYPGCEMDFVIARWAGKIVGIGLIRIHDYSKPRSINVMALYVPDRFRRQGVGTAIMQYIDDFAKKHKYAQFLTVATLNKDAQEFYLKCGFNACQVDMYKQPFPANMQK